MKLKLTSEVPNLNPTCAPITGEDSEPQRTASAREISSTVTIKSFVLDVANQKWEEAMKQEAEVAFEDDLYGFDTRRSHDHWRPGFEMWP